MGIYFHCAKEGYKIKNIRNNHKVSFCVVADTEVISSQFSTKYKSVIVFGTASEAEDKDIETALLLLVEKYSPAFIDEGKEYVARAKNTTKVVKIDIEHVTGKARV